MKTSILFLLLLLLLLSGNSIFGMDNNFGYDQFGNKFIRGSIKVKLTEEASVRAIMMQSSPNSMNEFFGATQLDNTLRTFGTYKTERSFTEIKPNYRLPNADIPTVQEYVKELERYFTIYIDETVDHNRVITALLRDDNIESAEPIWVYEAFDMPDDPSYSQMFQFAQVQAEAAWAVHKGENGTREVLIGIHDTGVQWYHPDLLPNLKINDSEWTNKNEPIFIEQSGRLIINPAAIDGLDSDGNGYIDDVIGFNFFTSDGTAPNDPNGSAQNRHGTHVASIAAGATNNGVGVASISWNVKFVGTKHSHNSSGQSLYNVDQGLLYMGAIGVDVINMSWGGGGFSPSLIDIFGYLNSLGITLVAAAGNGNNDNFFLPSSYPNVLSVASVTSQDKKTYYSTYGHSVDVSAPGGDVTVDGGILAAVPVNSYAKFQGTSMASPIVAGLAGLLKSYYPKWTPKDIKRRIAGTSHPIDHLNPQYVNKLGEGRINAFRALTDTELNFRKPLRLYPLSSQIIDDNANNMIEPGEMFRIKVYMVNFNEFNGSDKVTFRLKSDDPDIHIPDNSFEIHKLVGDDLIILQNRMVAQAKPQAKPKISKLYIQIETEDEMLNPDMIYFDIVIAGGVLVYEPNPASKFQSGAYINQYLEANNYDAVYSNTLPTSLSGFKAAFISYGHHSEAPVHTPTSAEIDAIYYYIASGGRLYVEASSHFSQKFFGSLGLGSYMGYMFGLQSASYSSGANPINQFKGIAGTFADGLTYFNTTQPLTTMTDKLFPNTSAGGYALFENVGWGNTMVACNSPYGHRTVTSSYSIGHLVDASCPSTRDVAMAKILDFFGLVKPLKIDLVDLTTCKTVPVELGNNWGTDCQSGSYGNLTVTGGSGNYTYNWHPTYGLSNPNVLTPTVTDPSYDTYYKLTVTDKMSGLKHSELMKLTVTQPPLVYVPYVRYVKRNNVVNLDDFVLDYNPNNTYFWYTDKGVALSQAESQNWLAKIGIHRFDVNCTDETGCLSETKRMMVVVSLRKESIDEQFIAGDNGYMVMASFPNPATDFVNVVADFAEETNATVSVIDLKGNVINQELFQSVMNIDTQLKLNNLSSGTYLVVVESDTDKATTKIIKK
ncbi:MAG: S8 family peptidase [Desulfobulbaceae bacterium]|nr:S8 family peptidase [Candidatus Kapabacteria bacterium]MBS3999131.1 S8 family peptidase [Desulfobulbaceae bacterium]